MERGGWCWSPAPPSPAGRPRIQRLLEQPERSGPDRSPGLHRSAEPIARILLVRPPHSQTGHQLSGSSPWSAPPGAQGRREPGTCVCCREVSPGAPGAFPSPAGAASCKLQQLGWVGGWESGGAGKLEAGWRGCRGQESGSLGFSAFQGHLSWGAFGAAALVPPACSGFWLHWAAIRASGQQPRRRLRARAWRREEDRRRKGEERTGQRRGDWAEMEAEQRAGGQTWQRESEGGEARGNAWPAQSVKSPAQGRPCAAATNSALTGFFPASPRRHRIP